jgi:hypothetical protein
MLFRGPHALETIGVRTSDSLDRIQRTEAEQAALRAQIAGERQLRFLMAEIAGAAQPAPVIGNAVENFAQAMRAPRAHGRAGSLARARSAWRYSDGTFMPNSEKRQSNLRNYEIRKRWPRARRTSLSVRDGTFARGFGI